MKVDTTHIEPFVVGDNGYEVVVTRKDGSSEFKVVVMEKDGGPFVFVSEDGHRATKAIYVSYDTEIDGRNGSGLSVVASAIEAAKGEVKRFLTGGQIG